MRGTGESVSGGGGERGIVCLPKRLTPSSPSPDWDADAQPLRAKVFWESLRSVHQQQQQKRNEENDDDDDDDDDLQLRLAFNEAENVRQTMP